MDIRENNDYLNQEYYREEPNCFDITETLHTREVICAMNCQKLVQHAYQMIKEESKRSQKVARVQKW